MRLNEVAFKGYLKVTFLRQHQATSDNILPVTRRMEDNFGTIGVLMGGPSEEREISIMSGKAVSKTLSENGEDVVKVIIPEAKFDSIRIYKNEVCNLLKEYKIDVAFIALHGWFGEDGTIQKILEELRIPYTGSNPLSCEKALNKIKARRIFESKGIPVPKYNLINSNQIKKLDNSLLPKGKFPVVIKPCSQGSSIGLNISYNFKQLKQAMLEAFKYDDRIIIEEYLSGRELTVGILGERILPVIEVVPREEFYNYKAKYEDKCTQYLVPAKISQRLSELVKKISFSAYNYLGCSGMGRVDIKLDEFNNPKILEVNTIPGLTSKSLLPKAARADGIDFYNLCKIILRYATTSSVLDRRIVHA